MSGRPGGFPTYRRECGCVLDVDWHVDGQIVGVHHVEACPDPDHLPRGPAERDALETLERAGWPIHDDTLTDVLRNVVAGVYG